MNLHETQFSMETGAVSDSRTRYYRRLEKRGPTETGPGISLTRALVRPMAQAIVEWLKVAETSSALRDEVVPLLKGIKSTELALLTIRSALHAQQETRQYGSLCSALGAIIEEHARWSVVWKDPKRSAYLREVLKRMNATTERGKHRDVRNVLQKLDPDHYVWTTPERTQVGAHLYARLVESTGCFELLVIREGARQKKLLRPTAEVLTKMEKAHDYASVLQPVHLPMVVPPVEYTCLTDGGLLSRQLGMVKRSQTVRDLGLSEHSMDGVYEAINAMQAVSWRVNKGLLSVLNEAWDENMQLAGLPSREIIQLPAKPKDIATNRAARKAWSKEAKATHVRNHRSACARLTVITQLACASRFAEYESIYFPHQLDWRGRVYPVASQLNPQGDDISRALLESAEGKPIGVQGGWWLAVHIANVAGHDKLPLNERVQWVLQHSDTICSAGMSPFGEAQDFWTAAGKPWAFLAGCMEWAGFRMMGSEYVTHLPVHVDGTCNGLQHLAAMQRDPGSAALVNLVPTDQPADVYSGVAQRVQDLLAVSTHEDADAARMWLADGIPRKLVKQPVMTVPYGVTRHGMRAQIMGTLNEMFPTITGEASLIASLLGDLTWAAVSEVVTAAPQVMAWFQECADVASAHHCGLTWVTPCGFRPAQYYCEMQSDRVEVWVAGKRTQIALSNQTGSINSRKQRAGIAPNVVHSYDASHLLSTVLRCVDNDVNFFAAVHDSYASLAPDMDKLALVLREEFVDHYSADVLSDLHQHFTQSVPEGVEMPPPPSLGDFNVQQVLESDYFFS